MEKIFSNLINAIKRQTELIQSIAKKVNKLEMGGGSASIEDFEAGKTYERNTLVVDPATETVYRVLRQYVSSDVTIDVENGDIVELSTSSEVNVNGTHVVAFDHVPTQEELDALPNNVLVTIFNPQSAYGISMYNGG